MADPVVITRHGTSTPDVGDLADFQLGYDSAADILYIRDGAAIITLGGSGFVPYTGATRAVDLGAFGLTAGGGVTIGVDAATNTAGVLKLWSAGANNYYTQFTAGTQTANATYTLPLAMATANSQALLCSTAGVLSWGTDFGANDITTTGNISGKNGTFSSTTYPVIDVIRDTTTNVASIYAGARLKRLMTGGTAVAGSGIGFYFESPDTIGTSTFCGMFGGGLKVATNGSEVGQIVFGASYNGADPGARNHLEVRATSATAGDVLVGHVAAGCLRTGPASDDGTNLSANLVVASSASNIFQAKIFTASASTNDLSGVGFGVHTNSGAKYMKSAIVHQRKSSWGQGDLVFCVDANADAADVAIGDEAFRITATGVSTTGTLGCGAITSSSTVAGTKFLGPEVKTDTSAPTDLTITTGAAKTLVLAEPVYKDINIAGYLLAKPASAAPGVDTFRSTGGVDTTIETLAFAEDEKVHGGFELQHDYKEGTDLTFHVHWQGIAAPSGTDNVQWRLNYIVSRDGVTLAAATSFDSPDTAIDTQYRCYRTDFAAITGTNFKIGDQFMFTLTRVAATGDAYAGDALIQTAGIHYQTDTLGSRTISAK